jgi:hypothetical protein
MNNLEKGNKVTLVAPEYLYEIYFERYKCEVKDGDRLSKVNKLIEKIKIIHEVSREEASMYLDKLIKENEDIKISLTRT